MAVRITRAGVGLTVGIVALALVVLGGLYLVKERGDQARRQDAINIARENLESESQKAVDTPSTDDTTDKGASNGSNSTGSSESTKNDDKKANEGAAGSSLPGTGVSSSSATPNELPATGMSDFASIFTVALLAFAGASYWASRRALSRLQ